MLQKLSRISLQKRLTRSQLLARRWVVERTFAWLMKKRRLVVDYEQLPETSESLIYIAMVHLILKRLAIAKSQLIS